MKELMLVMLSVGSCIVTAIIVIKLTVKKGTYECEVCHHKFEPTYKSILLAVYGGNERRLKCPNCNKRTWCKEDETKE